MDWEHMLHLKHMLDWTICKQQKSECSAAFFESADDGTYDDRNGTCRYASKQQYSVIVQRVKQTSRFMMKIST